MAKQDKAMTSLFKLVNELKAEVKSLREEVHTLREAKLTQLIY